MRIVLFAQGTTRRSASGGLFRLASDEDAGVRLSFVWASENMATSTPDIYGQHLPVFERLLQTIAETDDNRVVRARCLGAITVTNQAVTG